MFGLYRVCVKYPLLGKSILNLLCVHNIFFPLRFFSVSVVGCCVVVVGVVGVVVVVAWSVGAFRCSVGRLVGRSVGRLSI